MTLPTTPAPHPARAEDAVARVAAEEGTGRDRHHRGCYWDVDQATWVPYRRVPLPRPPLD
ncbi:hypothetical protein ACI79C_20585 [Geodermatophilus sp. SYSU D00697]